MRCVIALASSFHGHIAALDGRRPYEYQNLWNELSLGILSERLAEVDMPGLKIEGFDFVPHQSSMNKPVYHFDINNNALVGPKSNILDKLRPKSIATLRWKPWL